MEEYDKAAARAVPAAELGGRAAAEVGLRGGVRSSGESQSLRGVRDGVRQTTQEGQRARCRR